MRSLSKNEIKVVKSIFNSKTATRISTARDTGLSLVKISSIIKLLEVEGIITRTGKTESKSGRPSYIYQLCPDIGYSLGLYLTPDSFRIVAVDCSKQLIFEKAFNLSLAADPGEHAQNIIDNLSKALNEVITSQFFEKKPIVSVGVALPGLVDTQKGIWLRGLQLSGITHVYVSKILQEKIKLPVFIEDCSRSTTYLEKIGKQDQGISSFILIYLGMGMGSGIVIDNKIFRGSHGIAGEIGHIVHKNIAYRCSCNNVGCMETVISVPGILRVFKDRLQEGVISSLQRIERQSLSLDHILSAAQEEDRLSLTTLREIGTYLGDACTIMIKLFNPQSILISGPGSIFKQYFREPVNQVIRERVMTEMMSDFEIKFADYNHNHEAIGIALIALERYFTWRSDYRTAGQSH